LAAGQDGSVFFGRVKTTERLSALFKGVKIAARQLIDKYFPKKEVAF
jgi:hypothetical protein